MATHGPTAQLCDWVCNTRYEDIPADAREEALRILYDEVGGMVASATLESCEPVVQTIRKLGGAPECTVVGHAFRAPLLNAAMANGCIGHADEVDPTSVHGAGHFAATIVPTVLTVGEYVKASGRLFARALVIGAEVAARMQSTLNAHDDARPEFYYSAGAALGAAAGAGILLGLDADKMEHAMGAAAMGHAPLMSLHAEDLHQTKGLAYSGRTARAGVESALLAQNDFHAPREILTCKDGFFHAFAGDREAGHEVIADLGKKYLMKDLLYKRYSAGGPNLAPLYCFFQLKKKHKFTAEDITEIEIGGARARGVGLVDHHPSIYTPTVISLAACYGEYTFKHAHDWSYCSRPEFKAFEKRVKVSVVPAPGNAGRSQRLKASMTIKTRNGDVFQEQVDYPLMTPAELEEKFRSLVGMRLDQKRVADLDRMLKGVEQSASVAELVSALAVG